MAPNNPMPCWGNDKTMNMNPLILTNIQSSPYFKVNLYDLKTYHEVIDEIYYKVSHLEPWERGSRKTAGQTGMCGGVRGVGAGGIVSSAYCLLYKLFTLKLTRKQVIGLCEHTDSPYIRGLGFMYLRYTQDPKDLWDWFEPYFEDDEEVDVKAGGGHTMLIGEMLKQWLTKLEWYSTLFPRIPVPVQKDIDMKMRALNAQQAPEPPREPVPRAREPAQHIPDEEVNFGEAEKLSSRRRSPSPPGRHRDRSPSHRSSQSRRSPPRNRSPRRSPPRYRRTPPRRRSRTPPRHRSRSPYRRRSRSPRRRSQERDDFARELQREKERQKRDHYRSLSPSHHKSRRSSRSPDRHRHKKHKRSSSKERKRHRDRDDSRERSHSKSKNGYA